MAFEWFAKVVGGRLSPASAHDAEVAGSLKPGISYRVKVTRAAGRSVIQNGMLHAMIAMAVENFHEPISKKAVLDVLKVQTGHVDVVKLLTGQIILTPSSIAFEAMDQDRFNEWFPKAIDVLCRDFVPGLTDDLARREVDHRVTNDNWHERRAA